MKNLHLDLVRVTEAAAIAASNWIGRGNKVSADKEATDAMRYRLNQIGFGGTIAIGEGIKDQSVGLYEGEKVGLFNNSNYDIAVDPVEGTRRVAGGGNEAISVIAIAAKGCFYKTTSFYMDKLAWGPELNVAGLSLNNSVSHNVRLAEEILGRKPNVCVLNRERNLPVINSLRGQGCKLYFIEDCDVTGCLATCIPKTQIDIYWSNGGSPEGVIASAGLKCMGGNIECKCDDILLRMNDLVDGDTIFVATGITDGKLCKGVEMKGKPITHSLTMRSESKTVRYIRTEHGN